MFDKKTKPTVDLYKVVTVGSLRPEVDLNQAAEGGYRFLQWLDDKWDRNGYSDFNGSRKAIYIKTNN